MNLQRVNTKSLTYIELRIPLCSLLQSAVVDLGSESPPGGRGGEGSSCNSSSSCSGGDEGHGGRYTLVVQTDIDKWQSIDRLKALYRDCGRCERGFRLLFIVHPQERTGSRRNVWG